MMMMMIIIIIIIMCGVCEHFYDSKESSNSKILGVSSPENQTCIGKMHQASTTAAVG